MPGIAAYSATKGALAAMTRSWAAEFSPPECGSTLSPPGPSTRRSSQRGRRGRRRHHHHGAGRPAGRDRRHDRFPRLAQSQLHHRRGGRRRRRPHGHLTGPGAARLARSCAEGRPITGATSKTPWRHIMRQDIVPGGMFPDYELRDHSWDQAQALRATGRRPDGPGAVTRRVLPEGPRAAPAPRCDGARVQGRLHQDRNHLHRRHDGGQRDA